MSVGVLLSALIYSFIAISHSETKLMELTLDSDDVDFPVSVLVRKCTASSILTEEEYSSFAYHPTNIYDDVSETAWLEGVDGDGVGEYVELEFFAPLNIRSISIINGHGETDEIFRRNGSVKELTIVSNHIVRESTNTIILKNSGKVQTFPVRLDSVNRIRLIIASTYPGARSNNTGISEVKFDADVAAKLPSRLNSDQLEEIYTGFKDNFLLDTEAERNLSLVNSEQLRNLVARKYFDVKHDGTNYDRFFKFLSVSAEMPVLTPEYLRLSLTPSELFHVDLNGENIYTVIANRIWRSDPSAIPYIKANTSSQYHMLYDLLDRGDTRVVPAYLRLLRSEGIWHELCCEKMPSEILSVAGDYYTLKQIEKFTRNNVLDKEVTEQLKIAERALLDRYSSVH